MTHTFDKTEDILQHFGKLGMKWGVRNDKRKSSGSKPKTKYARGVLKRATMNAMGLSYGDPTRASKTRNEEVATKVLNYSMAPLTGGSVANSSRRTTITKGEKIADRYLDRTISGVNTLGSLI